MATVFSLICFGGRSGKTVTLSAANDRVTLAKHGLRDGTGIQFTAGTMPSGGSPVSLATLTTYYTRYYNIDEFTLHTSQAGALANTGQITWTGAGTGPFTVKSAYYMGLTAPQLARYGSPGSERIYDGVTSFYTDRSAATTSTTVEFVELGHAWINHIDTNAFSVNMAAAAVFIQPTVDGVLTDAWHGGVVSSSRDLDGTARYIPAGFILNQRTYYVSALGLDGPKVTVWGWSVGTDQQNTVGIAIGTSGMLCDCHSMYAFTWNGPINTTNISVDQMGCLVYDNTTFGSTASGSAGIVIAGYSDHNVGAYVANNGTFGNVTGMSQRDYPNSPGKMWILNNESFNNTTNWSAFSLGSIVAAGNNAGKSGDTPWFKTTDTGIKTLVSGDFVSVTNNDFHPSSVSAHQVDAGVETIAFPALDIAGLERPNYASGSAEYWDIGPFEFDRGVPRPAVRNLNFSGLVAGMQVIVYTTGTQTALNTVASSGTTETHDYGANMTVDYTIYMAGKIPIRETGVVLSTTNTNRAITVVDDQNYVASSGLTWGTNATIDTTNKYVKASAATSGRNLYSWMVESYRDQSALANKPFPAEMNGPGGLILKFGYETRGYTTAGNGYNATDTNSTLYKITDDGLSYLDAAGTATARFASMATQGIPTGKQGRYQQADGTGTTNFRSTGDVNQLIQIYGDSTHGSVNYTGYFVAKVQAEGYDQAELDAVATYGTLEGQGYILPLTPTPNGVATGNPSLATAPTISVGTYTQGGKTFGVKIVDGATPNSGTNLLRYLRYYFGAGGTFQGRDAFDWHDLIRTDGASFKTVNGKVYTSVSTKGVIVYKNDGTTLHPDFDLFTADDGTTLVPSSVAYITWAAALSGTTVIVYNDSQSGYMLDGGSTVGGGGYSLSITLPHAHVSVGDTIRLRHCKIDKVAGEILGVMTATGIAMLGSQSTDSVYATWGISGSAQDQANGGAYAADLTNIDIDIGSVGSVSSLTKKSIGAWYKYLLTLPAGLDAFYGAYTFLSAAEIRQEVSVVDVVLKKTSAGNVKFTDNDVRYYRSDFSLPYDPTGNAIFMDYAGVPFTVATGSGVTPTDKTDIAAAVRTNLTTELSRVDAPISGVPAAIGARVIEAGKTQDEITRIMAAPLAGKVSGAGTATETFKGLDGTTDRVVATNDASGNRTAVTVNGA